MSTRILHPRGTSSAIWNLKKSKDTEPDFNIKSLTVFIMKYYFSIIGTCIGAANVGVTLQIGSRRREGEIIWLLLQKWTTQCRIQKHFLRFILYSWYKICIKKSKWVMYLYLCPFQSDEMFSNIFFCFMKSIKVCLKMNLNKDVYNQKVHYDLILKIWYKISVHKLYSNL